MEGQKYLQWIAVLVLHYPSFTSAMLTQPNPNMWDDQQAVAH